MDERIKTIMADILELQPDEIQDEFGPDDAATWDSLNNLRMVTALEEEFDIALTMDEIMGMTNFAAIRDAIGARLNGAG